MDTTIDSDSVNPVIDCKGPLKGKGGPLAQWRNDTRARLAQTHEAMRALAAQCRAIEGREFGLYLYKLRAGQQLRWRMRTSRHTTWPYIVPMLDKLPIALAQWYREAQMSSLVLNHQEQIVRYELKTVERLIDAGGLVPTLVPRDPRAKVGRGAGGGRSRLGQELGQGRDPAG